MTPIDEWSFTRGTFLKGTGVLAVGFSASGVLARGAAAAGAKAGVGVPDYPEFDLTAVDSSSRCTPTGRCSARSAR